MVGHPSDEIADADFERVAGRIVLDIDAGILERDVEKIADDLFRLAQFVAGKIVVVDALIEEFAQLDDGSYYMVWEYIDGTNIQKWIAQNGPRPWDAKAVPRVVGQAPLCQVRFAVGNDGVPGTGAGFSF